MTSNHHLPTRECQKVREELSAYLDGRLSAQDRAAMERHIQACPECSLALDQLRQIVDAMRSTPPVRPPRSFALTPDTVQTQGQPPSWLRWWYRSAPAIAGVAALLLAALLFADLGARPRMLASAPPPPTAPAAAEEPSSVQATAAPALTAAPGSFGYHAPEEGAASVAAGPELGAASAPPPESDVRRAPGPSAQAADVQTAPPAAVQTEATSGERAAVASPPAEAEPTPTPQLTATAQTPPTPLPAATATPAPSLTPAATAAAKSLAMAEPPTRAAVETVAPVATTERPSGLRLAEVLVAVVLVLALITWATHRRRGSAASR